jgi:hypothetical protein
MTHIRIINSATDVPSLKRLSHSKIRYNLFGTPKCLKIERTATGSVEEIITPNKIITSKGTSRQTNCKIYHHPTPIILLDSKTPIIANHRIIT